MQYWACFKGKSSLLSYLIPQTAQLYVYLHCRVVRLSQATLQSNKNCLTLFISYVFVNFQGNLWEQMELIVEQVCSLTLGVNPQVSVQKVTGLAVVTQALVAMAQLDAHS